MIKYFLKFFKPTVYTIINIPFLGDSIMSISSYIISGDSIISEMGTFDLNKIYLFEFQAKRKLSIGYESNNIKLAKMLKEKGFIKSNYEYIQVVEDGEASTPYHHYLLSIHED